MNKIIYENIISKNCNFVKKYYLIINSDLLADKEFIKKIFINYCFASNVEMLIFLESNISSGTIINNFSNEFIQNLYDRVCSNSHVNLIEWLVNKYNYISLLKSDYSNILNACSNNNCDFIKYVGSIKQIPLYVYDKMFKISLVQLNLPMLKIIYELSKFIDLRKIDNFVLAKSFPPNITTNVIEWLKKIAILGNYSLFVLENNKLCVYDNLIIKPLPLDKKNILAAISKTNQCEICVMNECNIILDCTHKYCYYCIKEWSCKNNTCPFCRIEINSMYNF